MTPELADALRTFGLFMLGAMAVALVLALIIMALIARQVRKIKVPVDADFVETLHYTPFLVVVAVDLLDFALDILAAPITWIILDRWGLKALRGVSVIQAAVPFTQWLPALTLSWIAVRLFR